MHRIVAVFVAIHGLTFGQLPTRTDSITTIELSELVVTATRNERTLGALPMPVSLIPKMQIRTMGSLRLNEVLNEQTGLVVVPQVNGRGNGIQIQGFNPDYTLVLIDGEPLVGRNTGLLDLTRIAIGNIRQIEIVKGPSSSLYGSEALAGVINIITERPMGTKGNFNSRYGTNNTLDLSGDVSTAGEKFGVYAFANRYSTDGYDLSPETPGATVSPFSSYTFNSKLTAKISAKTDFILFGRYFTESQRFQDEVITPTNEVVGTTGTGNIAEWNVNPVLTHRFSEQFKTTWRLYNTSYSAESNIRFNSDGASYYHDDFHQSFTRPEVNGEYFINEKNIITGGAGFIGERVRTSRYGDEETRKQQTSYGFLQYEWLPAGKWNVIAGARFDRSNVYGGQLSPKLSARWEVNDRLTLKVSGGMGFKSPDFRQLYLNFNNTAGGGYSVYGTEVVGEKLAELEGQNRIQTYLFDPALIGKLQAERSSAINAGGRIGLSRRLSLDINGFYNSINNLIETQTVAVTTNNQSIFSYRNINRAYTSGLESNLNYGPVSHFSMSLGHQLLFAKDKDVVAAVKAGEMFSRDPETLVTRRLNRFDYFGLYNRSRHTGNFKVFYNDPASGWEGSVRVIYRGKFGIGEIRDGSVAGSDVNSNSILDTYDNFINGYTMVNLSAAKTFQSKLRLQTGIDNLFGYRNVTYIPNIPGRIFYLSAGFTFTKKNKQNKSE